MSKMNFDERVNMVKGWAERDAHWVVFKDESRSRWQKIRLSTIRDWLIPISEKDDLRKIYLKTVKEQIFEKSKYAPKKRIAVSQF